jgi:DNA polymerase I-like protein with 3'-5' exonuclease and polymerase domains
MAVRVLNALGRRFAHQVHDELIYVIKDAELDEFITGLKEQAVIRPTWAPELPIASEIKVGFNYGELSTL